MSRFVQIYSVIVCFSILGMVACYKNLDQSLSFLDHTLNEGGLSNCDLAIQGGTMALNGEHNRRAVISGSIGELMPKADVIAKTKCLILVHKEPTSLNDVIDIVTSIQSTKPVGVIFEVMDVDDATQRMNKTISFPLIFVDAGKFIKY